MSSKIPMVGEPLDRVDGRLKVTGAAKYSADWQIEGLVHAVLITSSIASGRIRSVDSHEAEQAPGVIAVITPFNAPRLAKGSIAAQTAAQEAALAAQASAQHDKTQPRRPPDRKIHLLQETDIFYNGQPIGIVVADTFEHARDAVGLVRVHYQEERPALVMDREAHKAYQPKGAGSAQYPADAHIGDIEAGWRAGSAHLQETYGTAVQTHNALEPHATIAVWDGDHLTCYDATQGVHTNRKRVADLFELPPENVRIVSKFIGGGFGSKGPVWSHVPLAAMVARQVRRPVKLVLMRRHMFGPIGFRGETRQKFRVAANPEGKLTLIQHDSLAQTSVFDEFIEPVGQPTKMLYATPNIQATHRGVRLNSGTPSFTRAPGEASGVWAIETAMDEMAYRLNMDPLEFRVRNYAETDPEDGRPFSSKSLRECYRQAADRFGWSRRNPQARATRDGNMLIGLGMATATYPTRRSPSSAIARMNADGTVLIQSGTQDIGTGTYTILTQLAAEALGVPVERVTVEIGDTRLPETPVSGGSQTAASTGSAVFLAAQSLRQKLVATAIDDANSPLHNTAESELEWRDGRLFLGANPNRGEAYTALLRRHRVPSVEARADAKPGEEQKQYSMHAFGAHFAEVHVDADLGQIRVVRYVAAFAAGRILNAKTARSQFMGGIVWGLGMGLMEETLMDPRWGRIMNADLAEYHVPVNADVPDIEIIMVAEDDPHVNPIGVKGIGEIGIVGATAALGNAVYHATGKRVRDLPITLDKVI